MSELLQTTSSYFSCRYNEGEAVGMLENVQHAYEYARTHWKTALSIGLLGIAATTHSESPKITLQELASNLSPAGIIYEFNPFVKEVHAQEPIETSQPELPHVDDKNMLPPLAGDNLEPAQVIAQSILYSEETLLKAATESDTITGDHNGQTTRNEINAYIDYLATLPPPEPIPCPNCIKIYLPLVFGGGSKSPAEFLRDNYSLFTAYRGNKEVMDIAGFQYNDLQVAMRLDLQSGFSEYDRSIGAQTSIHKEIFGPGMSVSRAMLPFYDLIELPITTSNLNDPTMEYLQKFSPEEIPAYQTWKAQVGTSINWSGGSEALRSKIVVETATVTFGRPELWWTYVGATENRANWQIADIIGCGIYYPNRSIEFDAGCTDLDFGYGNLFTGRGVSAHDLHSVVRHEFVGHGLDALDGSLNGVLWSMPPADVVAMQSKYYLFLDLQDNDVGAPIHQLTNSMQHWLEAPEVHNILTDGDGILDRYFRMNSRTKIPIR